MALVGWILWWALSLYGWVMLFRACLSWVRMFAPRWTPRGLLLVLAESCYTITDPPIRFFRKFIKPLRLGNVAFDLAFLAVFVLIMIAQWLVRWVFF